MIPLTPLQSMMVALQLLAKGIKQLFVDIWQIVTENNPYTRVAIGIIGFGLVMLAIMMFWG